MAVWASDVRVAPITSEWNFMPYFAQVAILDVKVVHGRELRMDVARVMNRRIDDLMERKVFFPRAFSPRLGCVHHYNIATFSELASNAARSTFILGFELAKRSARALKLR
jgi:hypothetical protein